VQVTGPIGLATVGDALWAVSSDQDAVIRIEPATGQVSSTVEVGDTPLRLAADGDLLWVSVFRAGRVVAIDTASGEIAHEVELGDGPEGVAVGHGAVWVVRQDAAELTRLSKTGKVLGHTPLGEQPRLVAIGPDQVWVANFGAGTLTRVRPNGSGAKSSAKICDGAQGIAVDAGVVWVTCTTGDEVVAVDTATLRVRGRLAVEDEPDAIRIVDGHLWVVTTAGPTLVEIDPDPDAPAELDRLALGDAPPLFDQGNVDLNAAGDALWVSSFGEDRVYRVRPG
jgi:DNA-binding beta-propeller fold protein YncE